MSDTHRIYLRHTGQRVTDKTVTHDRKVADFAYLNLLTDFGGKKGVAATWTINGKNYDYVELDKIRACAVCDYSGPFIDGGETCAQCKLVQ